MTDSPLPEVLLFDLGGVLVQTHGRVAGSAIAIDPEMPPAMLGFFEGDGGGALFESGKITPMEFAQAFHAAWPYAMTHEEFVVHYEGWSECLFPGAVELLDQLRPRFRLAALSNSNELHWRRNHTVLGVQALFELAISSHEVGVRKPDAALYHHALRELGVPAESVCFFDDRQQNVDAAIALGMQAHRVVGIDELRSCLESLGYLK